MALPLAAGGVFAQNGLRGFDRIRIDVCRNNMSASETECSHRMKSRSRSNIEKTLPDEIDRFEETRHCALCLSDPFAIDVRRIVPPILAEPKMG